MLCLSAIDAGLTILPGGLSSRFSIMLSGLLTLSDYLARTGPKRISAGGHMQMDPEVYPADFSVTREKDKEIRCSERVFVESYLLTFRMP